VDDGLCGQFCLCPQRGIVDTSNQTLQVKGKRPNPTVCTPNV
jgi:hypothetical protein